MRVRLLRDARILHKAGEIVEVSPSECHFLTSVGSAVEVAVKAPAKVETPEEPAVVEEAESVEEKPKKKTTRKK